MTPQTSLALIGLDVMGDPMAGHLARAGCRVTAYSRSPERAAKWREARDEQGLAVAFVPTPAKPREGGRLSSPASGTTRIWPGSRPAMRACSSPWQRAACWSIIPPPRRIWRADSQRPAARGIGFVDAPVSVSEAGAVNGKIAITCGGSAGDFARAEPVMQAYAEAIVHVGPAGAGQTAKMANQMCIAGVLAGLSEAVRLAEAAGLDLEKTYEAISGGAAQSWQMDDQFYADVQAAGSGRKDTSALVTRLPRRLSEEG